MLIITVCRFFASLLLSCVLSNSADKVHKFFNAKQKQFQSIFTYWFVSAAMISCILTPSIFCKFFCGSSWDANTSLMRRDGDESSLMSVKRLSSYSLNVLSEVCNEKIFGWLTNEIHTTLLWNIHCTIGTLILLGAGRRKGEGGREAEGREMTVICGHIQLTLGPVPWRVKIDLLLGLSCYRPYWNQTWVA